MARAASDLGVTIKLGEEVEQVLFEGRKAVGVRTASGDYRADALVINADFARAMQRLVPNHLRRRWTDHKIAAKRFSCSTFMLYLGIEGRYDNLAHHTIYMAKDYARNLEDIERRHILSEDPSFYVQNACVTDPTLAPPGCSTLYLLVPVTHQHPNVDWSKEMSNALPGRWLLKQLEKIGLGGCASSADSLGNTASLPTTGRTVTRSTAAPRSTCLTTSARCCTIAHAIAMKTWSRSTWSAAARIPAAGCR